MSRLRDEFSWLRADSSSAIIDSVNKSSRWWTFAGDRFNAAAAASLTLAGIRATHDSYSVRLASIPPWPLHEALSTAAKHVLSQPDLAVTHDLVQRIKFADCVPRELLGKMLATRYRAGAVAERVAAESVHVMTVG
jgi:hypothetical protein